MSPDKNNAFKATYRCYSISVARGDTHQVWEKCGKIILPASTLDALTSLHIVYPMVFKVTNSATGKGTHAGVLEFNAREEEVYMPEWMMRRLQLLEGSAVEVSSVTNLPTALSVKLRPNSTDFFQFSNAERKVKDALRNFSCLTVGDVINVNCDKKTNKLQVVQTEPAEAVSLHDGTFRIEFERSFCNGRSKTEDEIDRLLRDLIKETDESKSFSGCKNIESFENDVDQGRLQMSTIPEEMSFEISHKLSGSEILQDLRRATSTKYSDQSPEDRLRRTLPKSLFFAEASEAETYLNMVKNSRFSSGDHSNSTDKEQSYIQAVTKTLSSDGTDPVQPPKILLPTKEKSLTSNDSEFNALSELIASVQHSSSDKQSWSPLSSLSSLGNENDSSQAATETQSSIVFEADPLPPISSSNSSQKDKENDSTRSSIVMQLSGLPGRYPLNVSTNTYGNVSNKSNTCSIEDKRMPLTQKSTSECIKREYKIEFKKLIDKQKVYLKCLQQELVKLEKLEKILLKGKAGNQPSYKLKHQRDADANEKKLRDPHFKVTIPKKIVETPKTLEKPKSSPYCSHCSPICRSRSSDASNDSENKFNHKCCGNCIPHSCCLPCHCSSCFFSNCSRNCSPVHTCVKAKPCFDQEMEERGLQTLFSPRQKLINKDKSTPLLQNLVADIAVQTSDSLLMGSSDLHTILAMESSPKLRKSDVQWSIRANESFDLNATFTKSTSQEKPNHCTNVSLQDAFRRNCRRFITKSEQRVRKIRVQARLRKCMANVLQTEMMNVRNNTQSTDEGKTIGLTKDSALKVIEVDTRKRFTYGQMKQMTQKTYQRCSEVRQLGQKTEKVSNMKSNRMMSASYAKKLQRNALKGKVSWPIREANVFS